MVDAARQDPRKSRKRLSFLWAGAIVLAVLVAQFLIGRQPQAVEITSAHFVQEVEKGNIEKLHITPRGDAVSEVRGEFKGPSSMTVSGKPMEITAFRTHHPAGSAALTDMVLAKNPGIAITSGPPSPLPAVGTWLPFVVLIVAWFTLVRRMGRTPQTES